MSDYPKNIRGSFAIQAAIKGTAVQPDWNITNSNAEGYIKNKPTIPSAVTETIVSNWGFTKNTGTYSKPGNGIPKGDLESAVQTSLGKADSAVQPGALDNYVTYTQLNQVIGEAITTTLNTSV